MKKYRKVDKTYIKKIIYNSPLQNRGLKNK